MTTTLFIDTETFSRADLKAAGGYRYAQECELLLCSWAVDDGPVAVWDATPKVDQIEFDYAEHMRLQDIEDRERADPDYQYDGQWDNHPEDFYTRSNTHRGLVDVFNAADQIVAHNSFFDRHVLAHTLGLTRPIRTWRDTMVLAYSLGLPGNLDALGRAVGLPEDQQKLKDGKKLINRFCKPAPSNHKADRYTSETHPIEWGQFIEYARMDIVAMRELWRILPKWNYR